MANTVRPPLALPNLLKSSTYKNDVQSLALKRSAKDGDRARFQIEFALQYRKVKNYPFPESDP